MERETENKELLRVLPHYWPTGLHTGLLVKLMTLSCTMISRTQCSNHEATMTQVLFIYVIAMNFGVQDVLGLEEIFRSNLRKKRSFKLSLRHVIPLVS